MSPETAADLERARAAKRAMLAELAASVRAPAPLGCPILHALHVGCGASAIGATSAELEAALVLHDGSGLR